MKWSLQQEQALMLCSRWLDDPSTQLFYLAGFAGTGKTTLARELVAGRDEEWLFAAYTGKAAHVLSTKIGRTAKTVHSLIYRPNGEKSDARVLDIERRLEVVRKIAEIALQNRPHIPEDDEPNRDDSGINFAKMSAQLHRDKKCGLWLADQQVKTIEAELEVAKLNEKRTPAFQLWEDSPLKQADGIVVDECSMIDEDVGHDLLSFGKKVLILGDPAQLPPVGAAGYFTGRQPDYLLTDVHRQARESGILDLATFVREGGDLRHRASERWSTADCEVRLKGDVENLKERVMEADQVLVGMNKTRHAFNRRQRELLGRTDPLPSDGDRIISLVNDRGAGLLNGSMWRCVAATRDADHDDVMGMELVGEDDARRTVVSSWIHHFVGREDELKAKGWGKKDNAEMDYAYAITVHKSQGSQWNSVVLFDESGAFRGRDVQRSWTYTGITRAARKLLVVV